MTPSNCAVPTPEAGQDKQDFPRMPENMTQAMLDAMRIGHRGDYPSDELCRVRYAALQAAIRKDQTP